MLLLLHLLTLFLIVFLGFYVFVADPRSRAHQTFAAFIAFLGLWTTKDLLFWNFELPAQAVQVWAAASFIIALLMQCSLTVFAWVFPENNRTPRKKAAVLFAPGGVLIVAAVGGFLWHGISYQNGNFDIDLGPLAYAFVGYVYFLFCYGTWLLLQKYNKYRKTTVSKQIAAILIGVIVTGALKTGANIILPFFDIYSLLPYSSILSLPGVLIYAYAISNFELFSLRTTLDQFSLFPVVHKVAISIAAVSIFSFILLQIPITAWAFGIDDPEAWRKYLVLSIVTSLVPNLILVLLVLRSISRPIQRITSAAVEVIDGNYGTQIDHRKTNDEIGLLADTFNQMSKKMADDISKLEKLNEHLIRTEKLASLGTLSAGVAHEVNNPLASISSLVQILRNRDDLDDEAREMLKLISSQIQRIKQVTSDMTDFASNRPIEKAVIDVNAVVRSSIRLASFDKSFAALNLVKAYSDEIQTVYADDDQLQQVFLNLLLNARDALSENGTISIKTSNVEQMVEIVISDDGVGIKDEFRSQIFDPFFTTKPAGSGTGLGLAVCFGIIAEHNGTIEVKKNVPAGTIFVVRLPAAR